MTGLEVYNQFKPRISFEVWAKLRYQCQTDLWFLVNDVLDKDVVPETHKPVCDLFVKKDPAKPFHEQDDIKERLLLYPRYGYKSTIDKTDAVQWILCFPDIRILVLTATDPLAEAFVHEVKNYFMYEDESEFEDWTPFQKLFPEFCISKKHDGRADQFWCPVRKPSEFRKEPTVWAASILGTLPGWHNDVMKADDAVEPKNSATAALRQKVIDRLDEAGNLVRPGGYKDFIGTTYALDDAYAEMQKRASPGELKVLIKPAMWLKPGIIKPEEEWTEADCEFLFPVNKRGEPQLTWKFLQTKKRKNPANYYSQYMLRPEALQNASFKLELLEAQTIDWRQLPQNLVYYISWDFAYSVDKRSDFSVGAVGALDQENRLYIVDIFRARYRDSDLAFKVAESYKHYQPRMVLIENSNGAEFLSDSIRRQAQMMGIEHIPIDWFKVDTKKSAKDIRVGMLSTLLKEQRLFFVNSILCLTDVYEEFCKYSTKSRNDIPDAISHLQRVLPNMNYLSPVDAEGQAKARQEMIEKQTEEMIFGRREELDTIIVEAPTEPVETEVLDYFNLPEIAI